MIRRIVEIYGDSIMKGTLLDNITKRYSYKKDLLTPIEDSFPLELKNRSKFGCTIEKGEKMLDIALAQGPSCDTILLEYGGNDCDFHWDQVAENPSGEHFPHTPLARFESIYRSMIEKNAGQTESNLSSCHFHPLTRKNILPGLPAPESTNRIFYAGWVTSS